MELKLVKGSYEYKEQIIDMLKEWIDYNENHPEANTSPNAIFRNNYEDFAYSHHPMQFLEIIMRILHIIWNTWNIKNPGKGWFRILLSFVSMKKEILW